MFIEFQQRKENFANFYKRLYLKRSFTSKKIIWILIIGFWSGYLNNSGNHMSWSVFALQFLVGAAIAYLGTSLLPYILGRRNVSRKLLKDMPDEVTIRITTTEQGLSVDKNNETTVWLWETIRVANIVDKQLYILLSGKRLILIPEEAFSSVNEMVNFLGIVQSAMITKSGKNSQPPDGSHLYGRGWLGLIPLIGFFAGLVLLIKGAVEYKNKKLVLIGLAGMLFSVAIYSFMFYVTKYSDFGRRQSADIAQMQVNDIAKDIEFYKLQKGAYPDSLDQLNADSLIISIYDPLSPSLKSYNYKKVGNRYTVFSCGLDTIPGTKDDIYPTIKIADSSKIGFIRDTLNGKK